MMMSTLNARRIVDTRRQLEVETPEAVAVRYPLASYGSRGTAAIVDVSLIALLITAELVLGAFALYFLAEYTPLLVEFIATWIIAIMIVLAFVTFWGYYLYGEAIRGGRTLGKRWMRIRVVRDDGSRIAPLDAVIRNVVRLVDFLPGFPAVYGVGIISMSISPTAKRLGDYAAGTVVIEEPERAELTLTSTYEDERVELVRDYLRRRSTLTWEARYQVGAALLHSYGEEPGQWDEPTIAGRLADLSDLRSELS
jgi:uncharacterized RDD family membrane protein YckC